MQNKKQAVEVQGGEKAIMNEYGDVAVIPIKDVEKIQLLIDTGKHDLVDKYISKLPLLSSYASSGTLIPDGKMLTITQPDGSTKQVTTNSEEYKALYNSGKMMNYDKDTDQYIAPSLKEVEITAKKPQSIMQEWGEYKAKEHKDDNFFQAAISPFTIAADMPRNFVTRALTGKFQEPADAIGFKRPLNKVVANIALDPLNIFGTSLPSKVVGAFSKGAKVAESASTVAKVVESTKGATTNSFDISALTAEEYRTFRAALLDDPAKLSNIEGLNQNVLDNILQNPTKFSYSRAGVNPNTVTNVLSKDAVIAHATNYKNARAFPTSDMIEMQNVPRKNTASLLGTDANMPETFVDVAKKPTIKSQIAYITPDELAKEATKHLETSTIPTNKNFKISLTNSDASKSIMSGFTQFDVHMAENNGKPVRTGYVVLAPKVSTYNPPALLPGVKPREDLKIGETVFGAEKISDFPTNALHGNTKDLENQVKGVGASVGEALKKALAEQGNFKLISSNSHTRSGEIRYTRKVLNGEFNHILDLNGSKGEVWYDFVKQTMQNNPGKKWTTKEVEGLLKSNPYVNGGHVRFIYNAGGVGMILGGGILQNHLQNTSENKNETKSQ